MLTRALRHSGVLVPGHIDERVVRRRQHPDEHLPVMDLAGPPSRHLDRRARVVHERLLARPVHLAQNHIEATAPLPVPVASARRSKRWPLFASRKVVRQPSVIDDYVQPLPDML